VQRHQLLRHGGPRVHVCVPLRELTRLDEWLTEYGVTLGVGALILLMTFIVWDLARRSNAGKFGTLILYIGLAMGIVGFLMKLVITYLLENSGVSG
jgi:hypothetical protein